MSFEVFWSDCPFARFVGLNSAVDTTGLCGFYPVYAPVCGWQAELKEQILQLPEQYEHILLFLDDFFILSPVDSERLRTLLIAALQEDLDYLRLVPHKRAAIPGILKRIFRNPGVDIEPISVRSPYYSSLQVALWKRRHLMEMLKSNERHIWGFEHQVMNGNPHFAIKGLPPIRYVHVVEKGRWQPYARSLFSRRDLPFRAGDRIVLGCLSYLPLWLNHIKFAVFGYSIMRLKQYLRT